MNFGLQPTIYKPTDWWFKGYTPLIGGQTVPIDHEALLPVIEYQNNYGFDRYNCVSMAINNWFETEVLRQTSKEYNASDRFLAKASGTILGYGNRVDTVFDTKRTKGFVQENRWPDVKTPQEYYADIPKEIYDEALSNLAHYSFYREWVFPHKRDDILAALKDTTLPVTVKYAAGSGVLNPEGIHNHAVLLYGTDWMGNWLIFDHYEQVRKKYHRDYIFGSVLKPTLKKNAIMYKFTQNQAYMLVQGPEQKVGLYVDGVIKADGQEKPVKGLLIGDKTEVILNASARQQSKYLVTPTPLTLNDWNQATHYDMKGNRR